MAYRIAFNGGQSGPAQASEIFLVFHPSEVIYEYTLEGFIGMFNRDPSNEEDDGSEITLMVEDDQLYVHRPFEPETWEVVSLTRAQELLDQG